MIMLQPYVYEIVRKLVGERMKNKVYPYIAIESEIMRQVVKEVKETLDEMENDGLVKHNENINGIWMFRPTKEEADEKDNVQ